jgi:hypothetical protein
MRLDGQRVETGERIVGEAMQLIGRWKQLRVLRCSKECHRRRLGLNLFRKEVSNLRLSIESQRILLRVTPKLLPNG